MKFILSQFDALINVSKIYHFTIDYNVFHGKPVVYAHFDFGEDNSMIIKTFDNSDDAKNYLEELACILNDGHDLKSLENPKLG